MGNPRSARMIGEDPSRPLLSCGGNAVADESPRRDRRWLRMQDRQLGASETR